MYKQIIDFILHTALSHKAVNTAKYLDRQLINAQPTNAYIQFILEDSPYAQYHLSNNTFTVTYSADIVGFTSKDMNISEIQSLCYQIGLEVLAKIVRNKDMQRYISLYDYSFLALSHFTDDDSAGQRLTFELVVPNFVDNCSLDDNFEEVEIEERGEDEVTLLPPAITPSELDLNPIKLK